MTPEEIATMRARHYQYRPRSADPRMLQCICAMPWPCDTVRALDALEANSEWLDGYHCDSEKRAEKAEARLAAVLALCDDDFLWPEGHRIQDTVRAAATGDTAC